MQVKTMMLGLLVTSAVAVAQGTPVGPPAASSAAVGASRSEGSQLFIAPSGEPFRAPANAAYPVAAWFAQADRNHDGRVSEAEFATDFTHFFDQVDSDHDTIVRQNEIQAYEHDIAPEAQGSDIGFDDAGSAAGHGREGRRERRRGGGDGADPGGTIGGGDDAIIPEVGKSTAIERDLLSERPFGAGRFSLINIPEPIASMDIDFSGSVSRAEMRAAAHRRFALLDRQSRGYLTLTELPQSWAQQHPRGRRR